MAEKAGMLAAQSILAVAIGDPHNSKPIKAANDVTDKVRPYLSGLIDRLAAGPGGGTKYNIGDNADYIIDYQECDESALGTTISNAITANTKLIFCMSTTVVWAAAGVTKTVPIVGIVSDPQGAGVDAAPNVCGISGQRSQLALEYYENFLSTVPSLTKVYVLHKQGYLPSHDGLRRIEAGQNPAAPVQLVPVTKYDQVVPTVATLMGNATNTNGLLILPADWFFAQHDAIIAAARTNKLPDFWPVTDWVKKDGSGALGGYGVPQQRCGKLMADQVAYIFKNPGTIPPNRFKHIPLKAIDWKASSVAATNCNNVVLGTEADNPDLNIVP